MYINTLHLHCAPPATTSDLDGGLERVARVLPHAHGHAAGEAIQLPPVDPPGERVLPEDGGGVACDRGAGHVLLVATDRLLRVRRAEREVEPGE